MAGIATAGDLTRLARLLVRGHDDKAIARIEKVTVRSIQRRASRLERSLGASNRFQAGYLFALQQGKPGDPEP